MSDRSSRSSLSSPPASEIQEGLQTPEPKSVDGDLQMEEDEETLFVTPPSRRSARISNASKKPMKVIMKLNGLEGDEEKQRRIARYKFEYEALIQDINRRNQQRKYVETRNRIWKQSMEKAQARVEEIEKEREELMQKMLDLGHAQKKFNEENAVDVSRENDLAVKEKYDDYFNLETDELGMSELDVEELSVDELDAEELNGDERDGRATHSPTR